MASNEQNDETKKVTFADNVPQTLPVQTDVESLFMTSTPTFKVVLLGDAGVGKSSYLNMIRVKGNVESFSPVYHPTYGVDVKTVVFDTNKGHVVLNFWDCSGQEKFSPNVEDYFIGSHAFLIFCSMNSVLSFKNIPRWLEKIQNSGERKETVAVVATNLDCGSRLAAVLPDKLYNLPVFDVTSKNAHPGNKRPILYLLQQLTKDSSLLLK